MIREFACQNEIETRLFDVVVDVLGPVPRISRRHVGGRLLISIRCVVDVILKTTVAVDPAYVYLANGKPETIANIVRKFSRLSRAPLHHDPHELNGNRLLAQPERSVSARAVIDNSARKRAPFVRVVNL